MNALTLKRQEIADAVGDGLESLGVHVDQVYPFVPEAIQAPAVVVQPADPYLSDEGQPFGFYLVRFTVSLVAEVATNQVVTEALDQMVYQTVVALADSWAIDQVGEPYAFRANENMHLAADITISSSIRI